MKSGFEKLDNPVWHALSEVHENFALDLYGVKFYHPLVCPFGAFEESSETVKGIYAYAEQCESFYIVGSRPKWDAGIKLNKELICCQMVFEKAPGIEIIEDIIPLTAEYYNDLFNLVNSIQPGYFTRRTPEMGSYYGIFKLGQLVAVTGERMKMNTFTEVSAVVTHPAYSGKRFASQLVAHTVNKILKEDKIPFLHVAETNINAIRQYERLGFRHRRKISFWNFISQ